MCDYSLKFYRSRLAVNEEQYASIVSAAAIWALSLRPTAPPPSTYRSACRTVPGLCNPLETG